MKDKGIISGTVVLSKCGHDEGRIYLVIDTHESFLSLCDGGSRTLEAPKKKRRKHVRPLGQIQTAKEWITSLMSLPEAQQNMEIRKGIREFLDSHKDM